MKEEVIQVDPPRSIKSREPSRRSMAKEEVIQVDPPRPEEPWRPMAHDAFFQEDPPRSSPTKVTGNKLVA